MKCHIILTKIMIFISKNAHFCKLILPKFNINDVVFL
jgi:hypothetical protein